MASLPLHDAILIENGVVTRVNRIAYAISVTQNLAQSYKDNGVTSELVKAAEAESENFRRSQYGQRPGVGQKFPDRVRGQSPFSQLQDSARRTTFDDLMGLAKDKKAHRFVRVSKLGKELIAAELGVLTAYRRGAVRKSSQSALYGERTKTAREINRTYAKDVKDKDGKVIHRAGEKVKSRVVSGKSTQRGADRFSALSSTRQGNVGGRYDAVKGGLIPLDAAYGDELMIGDQATGFKGYHAQAEDRGTDAWAVAKARLRQKYRAKDANWHENEAMKAQYDADLAKLQGMRRSSEPKSSRQAWTSAAPARGPRKGAGQARVMRTAANPFSDVGDLALTNPGTGVGFLDSIEDSVSGLPGGEYIAPLIAPALLGAAAAGLHAVAVPKLKTYLPEAVQPYTYSVAGAAVAVLASIIATKASDETTKNLAGLIGGAALAFGVGYDVNSAIERKMGTSDKAGDDDFGALALGSDDEYGALALGDGMFGESPSALGALALGESPSALGAVALGDGMAYQTVPLGFDAETNELHVSYTDAALADAYFSGPDFDAVEGEAIMAGSRAFKGAAGRPPKRASGARKAQSNYAGRQFHRWGWLIKQISFPALQQVAALPPEQRLKVINELRSQALSMVARAAEHAKAEQLAAQPISAQPELGPQGAMAGYDMGGYGALVLAGNGY